MADIVNPTEDVTIWSSDGTKVVDVNTDNELLVHDQHVIDAISKPTAESTPDLWQYLSASGYAFSATTMYQTISGQAETDFLLIRNPSDSGRIVKIHDLDYTYNKGTGIALVRVYNSPTITNAGTLLTNNKLNSTSLITPVALVYQLPIISNRGTLVRSFGQSAVSTYELEYHLSKLMGQAFDILITIQPASNNTDHSLYVDWGEVDIIV